MILRGSALVFVAVTTVIAAAQGHDRARALDREGVALAQQGKLADAVDRFLTALVLDPESPDAAYHLALAYDRLGNTDQAILEYERALRLHPEFTEARYLMAGCCRKRGDFEGELRLLAAVTKQAPGFAEAHYNYGLALQRDLKFAEAAEQLRRPRLSTRKTNGLRSRWEWRWRTAIRGKPFACCGGPSSSMRRTLTRTITWRSLSRQRVTKRRQFSSSNPRSN